MDNNLSYPIGNYKSPEFIDAQCIDRWINEIEALPAQMRSAVEGLSEDQLNTEYRPGGWTIKQVINHVPDSHLNSYVRFHWMLTEDNPRIKAYDEKRWAELEYHKAMPIEVSLTLLESIHRRWVYLLKSLTTADYSMSFIHPETNEINLLSNTIGMYAWHGKHHLAHINNLKKRMGW